MKLLKFDILFVLELKKFDDGVVVVFLKLGVGGMMMIGMLLFGMLMLRVRFSGSGLIVKLFGNIVIGFSMLDVLMVNGIVFCGMLRLLGNSVKVGRLFDILILSGIGDVVIVGMVMVGRVSVRLLVVVLLGLVWIRMF